jgi:riboflavin synthase
MFTGIVEELGEVVSLEVAADGGDARLVVHGPTVTSDVGHGDSIAVSGICLTVIDSTDTTFTAELMAETLERTGAGGWRPGSAVNLERSVMPTTRLGGHLVQGHVDGVGTLTSRVEHPGYDEVRIGVPTELGRYLAAKGAVAVDGISLTVIDVVDGPDGTEFGVGIIPETRKATTMGARRVGEQVNIEVDVMAKYAERLLSFDRGEGTDR